MTDFNQLHNDMRKQNESIKDLTGELSKLNVSLVEVISDNKHRDSRISDCENKISDAKKDIFDINKQRSDDREEYKPVWDKSKKDQNDKAKWISQLTWFFIVGGLFLVSNLVSMGELRLPFQAPVKVDKSK